MKEYTFALIFVFFVLIGSQIIYSDHTEAMATSSAILSACAYAKIMMVLDELKDNNKVKD